MKPVDLSPSYCWVGWNLIWIRPVETGLGRWKLVQVVINVDAYYFLVFTDLTCCLEGTDIDWTPPHHVFTNNHSFSWYVLIRLQCFHWWKSVYDIFCFMNTYKYFDMLTNKYCKTGVCERKFTEKQICQGLLYAWVPFDENCFTDAACTLKLRVINPNYLKKIHAF